MERVDLDLSPMSAAERAKLSVLIEQDGDADLREHLLGALGRQEPGRGSLGSPRGVPDSWTFIWVMERLEEAVRVRAALPAATRPKAFGSAWPGYMPMTPAELTGIKNEIFRDGGQEALSAWEAEQNRVRPQPTSAQVSRMEQAELWPMLYLGDRPWLARAVMLGAQWASTGGSIGSRLKTKDPRDRKQFFDNRDQGLTIITQQLIHDKVPVS